MRLYILDLDNCLIFSSYSEIEGLTYVSKRKWHFLYHRPGLIQFLKFIQKTGEIVFYTSSKMEYARWVVSTFELTKEYQIFSRKHCKKKETNYGDVYYKSISLITIKCTYNKIIVLDDRTDLWDEEGVELCDIKPFLGEGEDRELQSWLIRRLKNQSRIGI
jgi:TFIIF-interacting CTD phosphatase-like protein